LTNGSNLTVRNDESTRAPPVAGNSKVILREKQYKILLSSHSGKHFKEGF